MVCSLCLKSDENIDHLFVHGPFAARGWSFLLDIFGISVCLPKHIDSWLVEILEGWRFAKRAKVLWICAVRTLL